jgi:hypothetical protein
MGSRHDRSPAHDATSGHKLARLRMVMVSDLSFPFDQPHHAAGLSIDGCLVSGRC